MRLLSIRSGLPVALVLAGLVAAGAAVPPPPAVTTSFTFVDPPGPSAQSNEGTLNATFKAMPAGAGNWSIDATFKPQHLDHLFHQLFGQTWQVPVHQNASAVVIAAPGAAVPMTAQGLLGTALPGGGIPIWVDCTLTVGNDGVVSVQDLTVAAAPIY